MFGLSVAINLEKSHLRMRIDTIQERVFPTDSWIVRFCDLVDKFLLLPALALKMWQQLLGHMASLEWFVPGG